MSDSQRPNPPAPSFEVPDLELEPVLRSLGHAPQASEQARSLANASTPTNARAGAPAQSFGTTFDFGDELADLAFERGGRPSFQVESDRAQASQPQPDWPTGRAVRAAELEIDPRQLAILADYGDPPESAALTLAYAYRVFTRQRELKRLFLPILAECEHAQRERESTLAEFSQAMRPAFEQLPEFHGILAPVLALEQRTATRGQALTSINAQLGAEQARFEAELAQLKTQLEAERHLESAAQRRSEEREANQRRADAKLKRVQIEMRALTQVATQKLGPQGGPMPEPEATQFRTLQERAEALAPEVAEARAEAEREKLELSQVQARLAALEAGERQIIRKKQASGGAYQQQLSAQKQSLSDVEIAQRAALADLARAVLAAPGPLVIPEPWLERLRSVSERAAGLAVRAEMFQRAIASYDVQRVRQGVRLACTAVGLVLVLFVFKLIF